MSTFLTCTLIYFGKISLHSYNFMRSSGTRIFLFLRSRSPEINTVHFSAICSSPYYQNDFEQRNWRIASSLGKIKATFSNFGQHFTYIRVHQNGFGTISLHIADNSWKHRHLLLQLLSSICFHQLRKESSHISFLHHFYPGYPLSHLFIE